MSLDLTCELVLVGATAALIGLGNPALATPFAVMAVYARLRIISEQIKGGGR